MSTPGKGAPVKSGWGTFISSAFEGVESKLDNMLSETEQQQQQQALQNKTAGTSAQSRDTLKPSTCKYWLRLGQPGSVANGSPS